MPLHIGLLKLLCKIKLLTLFDYAFIDLINYSSVN